MSFNKVIFILLLSFIFNGCTETYPLLTNTYEEAIVVEATLTNELKNQEIKITKTAKFEDSGIQNEKGAIVTVKDDQDNVYAFEEIDGIYKSKVAFQILPSKKYAMEIITADGKIYQSTQQTLTTDTPIESIVPSLVTNKDNQTGIQINVNSYDPLRTSNYYRYEYEETYKIIAPRWTYLKIIATGPESVELIPHSTETRTCYSTKKSTDIILVNTNDQADDRVNLPIRFIDENNYIIGHRYSILVRQFVENFEAYNFHKIMRDIAGSSGVLSPKQPGVLSGNIKCINNNEAKVIGYFDVATVTEKRIFFNYTDFFPTTPPPYFNTCEDIPFLFCFRGEDCNGENMIYNLQNMSYVRNVDIEYTMTALECGDCTSFSSNVIPSFWTN
ncbi:MAG: DUF4249 domain-containing protein [Flavobacterium sp.]|nr:MAG: DUF4249 domain-containing protein [Flavobacterium sp.]